MEKKSVAFQFNLAKSVLVFGFQALAPHPSRGDRGDLNPRILVEYGMPIVTTHLYGLDEGEEENSDRHAASKQFDETSCSKESEKAHVDHLRGVDDGPHHCDEVKGIPGIFEVRLRPREESECRALTMAGMMGMFADMMTSLLLLHHDKKRERRTPIELTFLDHHDLVTCRS